MTQVTGTFETGTNTNTIATGDAGSADPWDVVNIGVGSAAIYDNAHAYQTLAAKLTSGTATTAYLQWSAASLGTISDAYGRFYYYNTANPAANNLVLFRSTGTIRARIQLKADSHLAILDSAAATQATSSNALALNQWNRVEFHVSFSAVAGFMEVKIFQSADSTTATETLTSASNLNFGGSSSNEFLIGWATNQTAKTMWLDNIVWGAASYPGPLNQIFTSTLSASSVATPITGFKSVGKVLTT